jgi:23S rRNA pseudoU1915 N3-methylase RlmH
VNKNRQMSNKKAIKTYLKRLNLVILFCKKNEIFPVKMSKYASIEKRMTQEDGNIYPDSTVSQ